MKKQIPLTEQELIDRGYTYVGEYGVNSLVSNVLQKWISTTEVVIYDPYSQTILSHLPIKIDEIGMT